MVDTYQDVQLFIGYDNSDAIRTMTISNVSLSALADVKTKCMAINASLNASTDGGLKNFFVDDNGNPMKEITKAKIIITEETELLTEE